MALTKDDIQIIREALKPEFDAINKRFDGVDKELKVIKSDLSEVKKTVIGLASDIAETIADHEKRISVMEHWKHVVTAN